MEFFAFQTPGAVAAALLATILVGLSKGGLGGAGALMGVPLMALAIPPVQAAGILLPMLIAMDAVSLWSWWGSWDRRTLKLMLPGAIAGIGIGWATAALVSDDAVRIVVALVCIGFVGRWLWLRWQRRDTARPHDPIRATGWGALAGYTSFVAHAGGPPYQVYTMPLRQPPAIYTGTSVAFFTAVNLVKLGPYAALGQLNATNLATSAVLMPIAAVAVLIGAWIVRRMSAEVFYPLMYALVALVGAKLLWDGLGAL